MLFSQLTPYQEIEDALLRAIAKSIQKLKKSILQRWSFYTNHKQELTDRTILNLFSQNPANRQQALQLLNEIHYPLSLQSCIRLISIDIYPLTDNTADSSLVDLVMRQKITDSLRLCGFGKPIYNLITLNTSKRFVVVLFANGDALSDLSVSAYHAFYQQLSKQISPEMSIYIGNFISFSEMRSEIHRIDTFVANNVNKKPSLYFTEQEKNFATSMDVADNIAHWNRLLNSEQYEKLLESILSYLDFIASLNVTNLKTLCDLHQQLTQLFFIYAYQHEIDVTSLFTEEYSYNEYMDAFKDTSALRKAVSFIIPAIHVSSGSDSEKDAVSLAKKYITNNVSLNLSVKDVADYVHLSPEYFTKLFKKEVGQNIKSYILQVKVEIAKDLLEIQIFQSVWLL